MNWLAHLFLSEPDPAFRIGNLLPDFVRVHTLTGLPLQFQRGIQCHLKIDRFTDSHPIVRGSLQRFCPPYRRYAGILVDVFYDHFLARDWASHSSTPLPAFASAVYESFDVFGSELPPEAHQRLLQMRADNWLCAYGDAAGISNALQRISSRLRKPVDLAGAVSILEDRYEAFDSDFAAFFPQLREHIATAANDFAH
jgi:acyl carrier protein phosphodiesterase